MQRNAEIGIETSRRCRLNLAKKKEDATQQQKDFLNFLAFHSDTTSSATRTAKLVEERWEENKLNYRIKSKLTDQMKSRLIHLQKYGV